MLLQFDTSPRSTPLALAHGCGVPRSLDTLNFETPGLPKAGHDLGFLAVHPLGLVQLGDPTIDDVEPQVPPNRIEGFLRHDLRPVLEALSEDEPSSNSTCSSPRPPSAAAAYSSTPKPTPPETPTSTSSPDSNTPPPGACLNCPRPAGPLTHDSPGLPSMQMPPPCSLPGLATSRRASAAPRARRPGPPPATDNDGNTE